MKKIRLFGWIVLIAVILGLGVNYRNSIETVCVTVTDKERVTTKDESYYLVYTKDEVFKNHDALFFGKFNSSDVQGKLEVGKSYKVKVVGWRIPWLTKYRNIISVK